MCHAEFISAFHGTLKQVQGDKGAMLYNKVMISGILLITLVGFITIIAYRRPKLAEKVFKEVPLIDWLIILIVPLIIYLGIVMVVEQILARTKVEYLDYDNLHLLPLGTLFLIYGFVGNSIHFVSKVLSRYIKPNKKDLVYRVNELFHGKLSHYITYFCTLVVLFIIMILEINYPLDLKLGSNQEILIIISGVIFGVSCSKVIFYTNEWFGGHNKPLFIIVSFMTFITFILFTSLKLSFLHYPFAYFVAAVFTSIMLTFIFRQFLIFSKLGGKRRLKFLVRLLHI
ncbi:hypothetical protein A3D03_04620 [Candidatus Gottesmanbacteria bacterium RIFCSPHIGHO2_02_FULL_40_13]|uniref:Uncharacterized protein n=1 Tax=Candidatus Gottesmanbacteria bacterium RIFCSPHIGHO2_02_FULL_40_13 TaxID=1798384 RepID=A0A1F6AD24_9BACT|nr:MAG: hypothetical protein A3D03_04620 [Candidatus Gottesmanbacteria bacterium RIFCSPHIGHO2_02_FULL_40_13]